ncbi:MAG: carboxypeptidase regulatory-like domain-containing protein [Sulfurovum sp.]|nr:carboxypeptidase regulatory-like domain-containing protein [Sulfurovum sp.]
MNKFFAVATTILLSSMFFTGCVPRDVPLNQSNNRANIYNVNDVDMSDLDENLTESEMVIVENSENAKMARIPFPTSEYYALPRSGKGTIKGKIFVSDLYNEQVVGASTRLYLNPITSYSKQWYVESYLGGNKMQKADSRLFNYMKFTTANASGNFAFYGVPSGNYYLIGTVKCGTACGYESEQNIRLATRVSVQGNQIVKKDLTRNTQY